MLSNMIKQELKTLSPYVLIFNIVVYIASIPFLGLNYSMALGLLLGNALFLFNFIYLGITSERVMTKYKLTGDSKACKRKMFTNYLVRYFIIGVILFLSTIDNVSFLFNLFGTIIPLFYPKLIYLLISLFPGREVK